MQNALLITVIGIGLVFLAILFLWALMEILVRLIRDKTQPDTDYVPPDILPARMESKKIAALAVAVALQLQHKALNAEDAAVVDRHWETNRSAQTPSVSHWQLLMRSNQRQERSRLFSRKRGKTT